MYCTLHIRNIRQGNNTFIVYKNPVSGSLVVALGEQIYLHVVCHGRNMLISLYP